MKYKFFLFLLSSFLMAMLIGVSSCGKDDDQQAGSQRTDSQQETQDPDGTIELSMSVDGNMLDGVIKIDKDRNFTPADTWYKVYFASTGMVYGLGNVNYIPTTGWASKVAIREGNGYVAYVQETNRFYRMYVEPIETVVGGSHDSGYNSDGEYYQTETTTSKNFFIVKYQKPFKGTDEEIVVPLETMVFKAEGGTQTLTFSNKNIVPFTSESSQNWCKITTSSTNDYNIPDGIAVTVSSTTSNKQDTARIKLTTLYGKEKVITVTRAATGTVIYPDGNFSVPNFKAINNNPHLLYFLSNAEQDGIIVSSNESWCKVRLNDLTESDTQQTRQVKYIGMKRAASYDTGSNHYYQMEIEVDDNISEEERKAEITLQSKDGNANYVVSVIQDGLGLWLESNEIQVSASANNRKIRIVGDIPTNMLEVSCNVSWCKTSIIDATTNPNDNLGEERFLLCEIEANTTEESRTAVATIKMKNGKKIYTTNLNQEGLSLSLDKNEVQTVASANEFWIEILGDVPSDILEVSSNASWCKTSILDNTTNPEYSDWIGGRKYIKCEIEANASENSRSAVVSLKIKEGKKVHNVNVTQEGITLIVSSTKIIFDRKSNYTTVNVTSNYSGWKPVSSDDGWCKISWTSNTLTIRVDETTENREATISFDGFKEKITVKQNRYAVGDAFNESNLSGTVGYISFDKNLIYKSVGNHAWSTENVPTGATSLYYGQTNMDIIKKIPDFEKYYPAFAACEALNVDGITGWYMPAYNELLLIMPATYHNYWSSTEKDTNYSYGGRYYSDGQYKNYYKYYSLKNSNYNTIAIHLFE